MDGRCQACLYSQIQLELPQLLEEAELNVGDRLAAVWTGCWHLHSGTHSRTRS